MSCVHICVALYNGEDLIEDLLVSITRQTFTDYRVLLADDCSTDRTVSKVEPFLADPRFELHRNPVNLGFNRNLGQLIKLSAEADYLLMPGQDDVLEPDFLKNHLAVFEKNSQIGVVHSHASLIDGEGKPIDIEHWYWKRLQPVMGGRDLLESLLTHNYVTLPAALVRSIAFSGVSREFFSKDFTYVPDWWLWLLLAARGWKFGYLSEIDCHYRIHVNQLTQTMSSAKKTLEVSVVLADVTALLDGENYGKDLSVRERRLLSRLAHARLLRRGVAMSLRGNFGEFGRPAIFQALAREPLLLVCIPLDLGRYVWAKFWRLRICSGMIELFHPISERER